MPSFAQLVDPRLLKDSGSVFLSGCAAFSAPTPLYLLGINPGGKEEAHSDYTVERSLLEWEGRPDLWSAFVCEEWRHRQGIGGSPMQRRVVHLLRRAGLDPLRTPASNVAFVRTSREVGLGNRRQAILEACWPLHQAVIEQLGIRVVACMGGTPGAFVRRMVGADQKVDCFRENNARRWTSEAHVNAAGLTVLTLTHPSVADWTRTETDPSGLVMRALA